MEKGTGILTVEKGWNVEGLLAGFSVKTGIKSPGTVKKRKSAPRVIHSSFLKRQICLKAVDNFPTEKINFLQFSQKNIYLL